jgi:hypothetical protein
VSVGGDVLDIGFCVVTFVLHISSRLIYWNYFAKINVNECTHTS